MSWRLPRAIQLLDRQLRIDDPHLWITRVHVVLPITILLTLLAYIIFGQGHYAHDELVYLNQSWIIPLMGSAIAATYWCWLRLREPSFRVFRHKFAGWWVPLVDLVCLLSIVSPAFATASATYHKIKNLCEMGWFENDASKFFVFNAYRQNCAFRLDYLSPITWWFVGTVAYHAILLIRLSQACDKQPLLSALLVSFLSGLGMRTLLGLGVKDNQANALWAWLALLILGIFLSALRTQRKNWRSVSALVLLFLSMWWIPLAIVASVDSNDDAQFSSALFCEAIIFIISLLPTQWLLNRHNALPR